MKTVTTRAPKGGHTQAHANNITPSSYSWMDPIPRTEHRYWKWTSSQDGAIRFDVALSYFGPGAYGSNYAACAVYKIVDGAPVAIKTAYQFTSDCLMVEAGDEFLFDVYQVGFHDVMVGVVLRLSAVREPLPSHFQLPDRAVQSWTTGDFGWSNLTAAEAWDTTLGWRASDSNDDFWRGGYSGSFRWDRSFFGLDPIYEIGDYLAKTVPWQRCLSGGTYQYWAAPGFDGTLQGVPPEPGFYSAFWGGGGPSVYSTWEYTTFTLPPFTYVYSTMAAGGFFEAFSLKHQRWRAGPKVGYTDAELLTLAGIQDPFDPRFVGFLFDDDECTITKVEVIPDSTNVPIGNPAPVDWWVAPARLLSQDPNNDAGPEAPTTTGWGPGHIKHNASFVGPDSYYYVSGVVEGDTVTGKWPHALITESSMEKIGTYDLSMYGTTPIWEVPEDIWQAALEVEQTMMDEDTFYDEELTPQYNYAFGLMFMASLSEHTEETPEDNGLAVPVLGTTEGKGLQYVCVWPRITFRPVSYRVCLAPELETPVRTAAGGPLSTRQHFEPIPVD